MRFPPHNSPQSWPTPRARRGRSLSQFGDRPGPTSGRLRGDRRRVDRVGHRHPEQGGGLLH
ncbi:hypothetical protein, partial [Buchananella hordeovulneris]|uniref:hypothetical protein n=1 Tax=Buchananella hordeovulneris TaxID=52770 RepID=UPI0026DB9CA7